MPRITLDLVRKKSEHHDGLLQDMQEISLHQLNLEKIEVIGTVCRRLQILYLQNNLIERIENLNRLKELKYLNLALNNITLIENLEGCEKLEKLDLTVNFVDIDKLEQSIECLKHLEFFRNLHLLGNPCTEFKHYREFVIASLPQITNLDGKDITKTERLSAIAGLPTVTEELRTASQKRIEEREKERLEDEYAEKVVAERSILKKTESYDEAKANVESSNELENKEFGPQLPEESKEDYYIRRLREREQRYTPQSRLKIYQEEVERKKKEEDDERQAKERFGEAPDLMKDAYNKLNEKAALNPDGSRPSQRNTGKYPFRLEESSDDLSFTLEVEVPKYLDTSALEVDIHPTWLQCLIKGKNLLLHLDEEVNVSDSKVQRIMISGKLLITMPKRNPQRKGLRNSDTFSGDLDNDITTSQPESTSLQSGDGVEYVAPAGRALKPQTTQNLSGKTSSPSAAHTLSTETSASTSYTANESQTCASLNPAFREVSTRVSKELMQKRRQAEDEAARAREEQLRLQALKQAEEVEERRRAKSALDAGVSELAAEMGVDLDDLPDLE